MVIPTKIIMCVALVFIFIKRLPTPNLNFHHNDEPSKHGPMRWRRQNLSPVWNYPLPPATRSLSTKLSVACDLPRSASPVGRRRSRCLATSTTGLAKLCHIFLSHAIHHTAPSLPRRPHRHVEPNTPPPGTYPVIHLSPSDCQGRQPRQVLHVCPDLLLPAPLRW